MTFRQRLGDWSLIVPLLACAGAMGWMWLGIAGRTGGMSYTIDDSYIHGTLARNLAFHGVLGIVPDEFSAASSSPLWTTFLALIFRITGPLAWIPGALATLFGLLCAERAHQLLVRLGVGPVIRCVVVLAALAYAPLLPMVSTGMEHTMHVWAVLGLFGALASPESGKWRVTSVFVWAAIAAGVRYESLFALPVLLLWFAWDRRWKTAIALGSGMALPVLAFAAYSMLQGGYPLPNSLMLKGNLSRAWDFRAFRVLLENQHMLVPALFLTAAVVTLVLDRRARAPWWIPTAALGMMIIHLQLAQLGWFYRYEGYLIVLSLVTAAPLFQGIAGALRSRPALAGIIAFTLLAFLTLPLAWRFQRSLGEILPAAGNIHDQQLQMAKVIRHLGPGARIAVNDLGATSFLTEARVLDLWGLGDNRIARAKIEGRYGAALLEQRLREAEVDFVIVYPGWFNPPDHLPSTLIPVETWFLHENLICGSDTVVFYGTHPEAAGRLALALDRYRALDKPPAKSTNEMRPIRLD